MEEHWLYIPTFCTTEYPVLCPQNYTLQTKPCFSLESLRFSESILVYLFHRAAFRCPYVVVHFSEDTWALTANGAGRFTTQRTTNPNRERGEKEKYIYEHEGDRSC